MRCLPPIRDCSTAAPQSHRLPCLKNSTDEHCFVNAKLLYQKIPTLPPGKTPNLFDKFCAIPLKFTQFSAIIKWEKVREVFCLYTRFLVLLDTTFYPCNFFIFILSEQSFPQRRCWADRQQFSGRLFCLSSAARFGGKGDFFHAEFHF